MTRTAIPAFKEGDKVRFRSGSDQPTLTVRWVSKCGELIATEYNGHWNTCSWASVFERAA